MTRVRFLKLVTLAAFLIIAARLFSIQIIEHDKWVEAADAQHTLLEKIVAKRGEIYMMDMNDPVPVVLNQTVYSVIIDPAMTDKDKIKAALEKNAPDKITKDIDELYEIEGLRYFVIARNVSRDAAKAIADEGIAGVWFQNNSQRVYPEGTLASGLLGFVNADGIGQYGVEGSLNEKLKGKDGMLKTISDINNIALSIGDDNIKIPAENGKNVVLTVDRGIQRGVEEILAQAINETPATNFSALVMEPTTGKVLAMANYPNYDPANYGNVKDASAYINYVTEVPYEPASTCKPFAFSAAINEGRMTGETTYWNEGYEMVDGWRINNAEQRSMLYGEISMKTALYWSLNTGSIKALKLLGDDPNRITQSGREKLYDYYHNKFRLGQATGIELIEAEGTIADPNEGYGRDSVYANMTFGQNMYVTMIQVATAFSAVVNGGNYIEPTIVAGEYEDGALIPNDRKINATQVISEETSAMMRDLLRNNRNYKVRGGIDRVGYAIGGKSGTAQVVRNGSYDNTMSETIASYIGFGGTDGELPKYVIMVKMWGEGEYMDSGRLSEVAFDPISNFMINYLKIKPGETQDAD